MILKVLITCFMGTYLSAVLFETPRRSAVVASVIAAAGYLIYVLLADAVSELLAYYIGTLCIVLLCEILARRIKTPTTTMLFPALIALVPGIGLYQTMYALAAGDTAFALDTGMNALMIAGCMALAIASGRMIMVLFDSLCLKKSTLCQNMARK